MLVVDKAESVGVVSMVWQPSLLYRAWVDSQLLEVLILWRSLPMRVVPWEELVEVLHLV